MNKRHTLLGQDPNKFVGATVQVFEFGNGRYEHSMIFAATSLEPLVYLLEDPLRHIREIQGVFPYDGAIDKREQIPWGMRAPITAIITHGSRSLPSIVKAAQLGLMNKSVIGWINDMPSDEKPQLQEESKTKIYKEVRNMYPEGAFFAEFAVGTRTLYITYFNRTTNSTTPRYSKSLTDISLAFPNANTAGTGIKNMLGTIHFDLYDGGIPIMPIDRAQYIVSYLENPTWLAGQLNKPMSYKRTNALLVAKGTAIKPEKPPKNPTTGKKPFFAHNALYKDEYPNVTVEGLSDCPGPIEPCTLLPTQENPGTDPSYVVHDMIVKTY